MKYLMVALALCLSFSTAIFATTPPNPNKVKVSITVVDKKTVELRLVNLQKLRTDISIQSLDGATTYFQNVVTKHNGYRAKLNLNELKAGKYLLVVKNGSEKRQQVIVIDEEKGMLLSSIK